MKKFAATVSIAGSLMMIAGAAAAQNAAQCDAQARQYANAYTNPGGSTVGGAIVGGILGGIAAEIAGGKPAAGAVAGAIGGGTVGAVASGAKWNEYYNQAFHQCMSAGGAVPVATCPALVPPSGYDDGYLIGSPQWIAACDAKYNSFSPATWLFNGYDGCQHYCNL